MTNKTSRDRLSKPEALAAGRARKARPEARAANRGRMQARRQDPEQPRTHLEARRIPEIFDGTFIVKELKDDPDHNIGQLGHSAAGRIRLCRLEVLVIDIMR